MTETEYLKFEAESDLKHEFIAGYVVAMTGASSAHNLIVMNTGASLHQQLGQRPCLVYPSDMRVSVSAAHLYTYPDISVVCGEPEFAANVFDTLLNPVCIIEVLSPSTENYDRGKKFQAYRLLPSLQEYVLITQDHPRVEHYTREQGGAWVFDDAIGLDGVIKLPALACTLLLKDVYAKVAFPPSGEAL